MKRQMYDERYFEGAPRAYTEQQLCRATEVSVRYARFYASIKHAGQTYQTLPYTHHLQAVVEQVIEHQHELVVVPQHIHPRVMLKIQTAAWLHDVLEDCQVRRVELEEEFGPGVAELVWNVTDEPGTNRRERQLTTYPKIRGDSEAVYLKLCDRLANVRAGGREMYRKEYPGFRQALYRPGEYEGMWAALERALSEMA